MPSLFHFLRKRKRRVMYETACLQCFRARMCSALLLIYGKSGDTGSCAVGEAPEARGGQQRMRERVSSDTAAIT